MERSTKALKIRPGVMLSQKSGEQSKTQRSVGHLLYHKRNLAREGSPELHFVPGGADGVENAKGMEVKGSRKDALDSVRLLVHSDSAGPPTNQSAPPVPITNHLVVLRAFQLHELKYRGTSIACGVAERSCRQGEPVPGGFTPEAP